MPTKILAIDDSKTMRLAIKITFAAEDAEVVAVSKGSEAVPRAKNMAADIVLVDHKLAAGEPSGLDVVRALKSDPATAKVPVVLLVPAKGGVSEAEVSGCGATASLAKPFDTQELIDLVAAVLRGEAVARPAATLRPPLVAPAASPAPPRVAAPAAAKPIVPPLGAPSSAPRPAVPAPAVPATQRPAAAAPVAPAAAVPAAKPPSGPSPIAAGRPPSGPSLAKPAPSGPIPIAIPIPFTAASAPTSGMLARLKAADGGAAAGLDPKVAAALLALSREVVEQVVWEVVPELAEAMIKERAQQA